MLRLVARNKLPDSLENIERQVAGLHASEKVESLRLSENPAGNSFLDENRPRPVLSFVNRRVALALEPQQRSYHRRPGQHRAVGVVEHIVKAVIVRLDRVVGQPVADVEAVALLEDVQ